MTHYRKIIFVLILIILDNHNQTSSLKNVELSTGLKRFGIVKTIDDYFAPIEIQQHRQNPFFPFFINKTLQKGHFSFAGHDILECKALNEGGKAALFLVVTFQPGVLSDLTLTFGLPEAVASTQVGDLAVEDASYWSGQFEVVARKYTRIFGEPVAERCLLIIISSVVISSLPKRH